MGAATDTDFDRWLQTPAADIPIDPNSAALSANEWKSANYGLGQPLNPICQMGLQPPGLDWAENIYDLTDPDIDPKLIVTRRVFAASGYKGNVAGQPRGSMTAQVLIGAEPGDASDAQIAFRGAKGTTNLWGYSGPWTVSHSSPPVGQSRGINPAADFAAWLSAKFHGQNYVAFDENVDLVAGTVEFVPNGAQGNGCLMSPAAPMDRGTPTAKQVAAGAILQAIAMGVSTLLCPPPGSPGAMPSVFNPAGIKGQAGTVPTAQRFHLLPAKVDLSQWITSRLYTGVLASTAEIFGRAFVDLGWFNAAYTGTLKAPSGPAQITCSGTPADRDLWRTLGISDPHTALHLLDGLITQDAIVALTAPTGVLPKGVGLTQTNGLVTSFSI